MPKYKLPGIDKEQSKSRYSFQLTQEDRDFVEQVAHDNKISMSDVIHIALTSLKQSFK